MAHYDNFITSTEEEEEWFAHRGYNEYYETLHWTP